MKLITLIALHLLLVAEGAWGDSVAPDTTGRSPIELRLVGEARLSVLFWDIYDASLYAPGGEWSPEQPFRLELKYLRNLIGEKIAERSIAEIRQQGFADERTLARWYELLVNIIPDVTRDDVITGRVDTKGHTRFYLGNRLIGEIAEPEFSRAFFGIWLNENTSEPDLREHLLGRLS